MVKETREVAGYGSHTVISRTLRRLREVGEQPIGDRIRFGVVPTVGEARKCLNAHLERELDGSKLMHSKATDGLSSF